MFAKKYAAFLVLVSTLLAVGASLPTATLKADEATPRILLVGDSWTSFMWTSRSIRTALSNRGLGQYEERGARTAISGTTAAQWIQRSYLELVREELTAYSTIDIVLYCAGGNDRMQGRTYAQIAADVETFADAVLAFREDLKLLFVGYTYLWRDYGYPSFRAQNDRWTQFERMRFEIAQRKDRMHYQLNLGILQSSFGFEPYFLPGAVPPPGGPPDYEPFQGGDPNFGAPPDAFRDDLHLTEAGYLVLAERAVDQFLAEWLSEGVGFLRGDCNGDGTVDIADPVYALNHLFGAGAGPSCTQTADANDDNVVDIADPVYQLNHLFGGGPALATPVGKCGTDPTPAPNSEDDLPCEAYTPCGS